MRQYGDCALADARDRDSFAALTRAIAGQQLSVKAAATITRRFEALFHGAAPTAGGVRGLSDARLRSVGLSRQKLGYLRDLSQRVMDRALRLESLGTMSDDAVVDALTQVKGIGRWTADIFLIFHLQRPDVLPVGDLGIVKAITRHYGLRKMPTADRMRSIGERWRPYRSVACWYLWASLENTPGDS